MNVQVMSDLRINPYVERNGEGELRYIQVQHAHAHRTKYTNADDLELIY